MLDSQNSKLLQRRKLPRSNALHNNKDEDTDYEDHDLYNNGQDNDEHINVDALEELLENDSEEEEEEEYLDEMKRQDEEHVNNHGIVDDTCDIGGGEEHAIRSRFARSDSNSITINTDAIVVEHVDSVSSLSGDETGGNDVDSSYLCYDGLRKEVIIQMKK